MSELDYAMQAKIHNALKVVNEGMEAHFVESIISLFHQGVLKHYVRNPRHTIEPRNFKMTIEAANGVCFEGREKLVEMETEIEKLQTENKELEKKYAEAIDCINLIAHNGLETDVGAVDIIPEQEAQNFMQKHKQDNEVKG